MMNNQELATGKRGRVQTELTWRNLLALRKNMLEGIQNR